VCYHSDVAHAWKPCSSGTAKGGGDGHGVGRSLLRRFVTACPVLAFTVLGSIGCSESDGLRQTGDASTDSSLLDGGGLDEGSPGTSDAGVGDGGMDESSEGGSSGEGGAGAGTADAVASDGSGSDDGGAGDSGLEGPLWATWPMPNGQVDVTAGAPNLESYTDNGDGMVTDDVTGLVWQKVVSPTIYIQSAGFAYCAGLSLGGYADWRVPSIVELMSIVDPGQFSSSIDNAIFPDTPSSFFWTSTPSAGANGEAWSVVFDVGAPQYAGVLESGYVRCVRTGKAGVGDASAFDHYAIANGTVRDTSTKLTWQRAAPSSTYAQADAVSYCSSLSLNGATWRLPTVKELLTIVDFSVPSPGPTVDSDAFPGIPADHFWSATPYAGAPGAGWFVTFSTGFSDFGDMSNMNFVRCVH